MFRNGEDDTDRLDIRVRIEDGWRYSQSAIAAGRVNRRIRQHMYTHALRTRNSIHVKNDVIRLEMLSIVNR
jgi:hypothetical protein